MASMRVLTVGHSYAVALNRSIMAQVAQAPGLELTLAAPEFFQGDLRPIPLEYPAEPVGYRLVPLPAVGTRQVHTFWYRRLHQLITPGAFDLIHIWEEPFIYAGYQLARAARRAQIPYFFWTAQNLSKRYPVPFRQFERVTVANAAGWVACGELVRQTMLRRGYPEASGTVIGLAVDEQRFTPDPGAGVRMKARLGLAGPVIGYLGRLTAEKGLLVLMAALERVPAPWSLLVVGGGPFAKTLREWAATRGLGDRLCLAKATHEEVPHYLRAMDLLVAPSQTTPRWKEQFGRMITEAFACGVPVIGSDSGEIPYVIGDAGLVAPETDVAAWAHAISKLLTSPGLRAELASAGRRRCLTHFSSAALAERYLNYYQRLLESPTAPAHPAWHVPRTSKLAGILPLA